MIVIDNAIHLQYINHSKNVLSRPSFNIRLMLTNETLLYENET